MVISISTEDRLRNREDSERHVVFLGIDEGLLPYGRPEQSGCGKGQAGAGAAGKEDGGSPSDPYGAGAAHYGWEEAVHNLHDLLRWSDAELVICSERKQDRTLGEWKRLLDVYKLGQYLTDRIPCADSGSRQERIGEYLEAHPDLGSYVIVDGADLEKYFRGHTVCTGRDGYLTRESKQRAARILEFGPWWEEQYGEKTSGCVQRRSLIKDHFNKVIFLDIDGVLNDEGAKRDREGVLIDPVFVRNLAWIIDETGAEVILSSSWRYTFGRFAQEGFTGENKGIEMLLENFDRHGIRVSGITPLCFNGPDGRPFEIRSWLCHRPEVENFVILDDDTFWRWNWLASHVVCTMKEEIGPEGLPFCRKGLDREYARRAIEILGGLEPACFP